MSTTLLISQMVLALLLIGSILLQAQGTGLGATWAGGGESYHTKRGIERVLFGFTIVGIILFAAVSLASLLISR